jgi:hypothetical protein
MELGVEFNTELSDHGSQNGMAFNMGIPLVSFPGNRQ